MKAKFIGVPGENHQSIFMYGQNFPVGKWQTVNDPLGVVKLKGHPHFEAQTEAADEAEDAVIKREMTAALEPVLKAAEVAHVEDLQAQADQAEVNAEADAVHDELLSDESVTSAVEFQRETQSEPVVLPSLENADSAIEYQNLTQGADYGNGSGSGEKGTAEVEQPGGGGNRKRGRPRNSDSGG